MTEIEKQLLIENNELRFRLAENKMLIEALQKKETKANIVSRGDYFENPVLSSIADPYRIIIGEMKEGACIISKEDKIMFCNQQFADIFEWNTEQIQGTDFSEVFGKLDKKIPDLLLLARKKGKSGKVITQISHPDKIRHYFMTATLLSTNNDDELFIILRDVTEIRENRVTNEVLLNNARLAALNIMEDEIMAKNELARTNSKLLDEINERKKSEALLKQSRVNLLEAQKLAHIGNWSFDYKTEQASFSEEIHHIFGLDPKLDIRNIEEIRKLIHPDQWKIVVDSVRKVIEQGIISEFEFQIQPKTD